MSAFYEFFMDASSQAGEPFYEFEQIPTHRSPDGFIKVIDGSVRKQLYKSYLEKNPTSGNDADSIESTGMLPQKVVRVQCVGYD